LRPPAPGEGVGRGDGADVRRAVNPGDDRIGLTGAAPVRERWRLCSPASLEAAEAVPEAPTVGTESVADALAPPPASES
jgi:hypothetical protein